MKGLGIMLQNVELTRVDEKVNYVEEKNEKDGALLLANNDTNGGQENTQYPDHMSENKNMFRKLNESMKSDVTFGDDSKVPMMDKGNTFFMQKMVAIN